MNAVGEITPQCGSPVFVPKNSVVVVSNLYAQGSVFIYVCNQFQEFAFDSRPFEPIYPDCLSRSPFIKTRSKDVTAPICLFFVTSWQHDSSLYTNLTVLQCDWKRFCSASIGFLILKIPRLASSSRFFRNSYEW